MTYYGRHDLPARQPLGYPPPLHQVPRYNDMKDYVNASVRYVAPDNRPREGYTTSHREGRPPSTERHRRRVPASEGRYASESFHEPGSPLPLFVKSRNNSEFGIEGEYHSSAPDRTRRGHFGRPNDMDTRSGGREVRDEYRGAQPLPAGYEPKTGMRFGLDKERPRGRGGYEYPEQAHSDSDDDEYSDRRPSRNMRPGSHNAASHLPLAPEYDDSARFHGATYSMRSDSRSAERPRTRTPDFDSDERGRRSDAFGRAPVSMRPETRYTERPRSREAGVNRSRGTRDSSRVDMPPSAMRSSSRAASDFRSRGHGESRFQRSGGGVGVDVASEIPVSGSRYAARHEVREHAPQYNPVDGGIDEPLDTRRVLNGARETLLPEEVMTQDFKKRLSIHDTRGTKMASSYNGDNSPLRKIDTEPGDIRGVSSHSRDPLHFLRPEREYPGRGLSGRDDPDARAMVLYRGGIPREPDHERLKRGMDSRRQDPDRTFVPYRTNSRGREGSQYGDYGRTNSTDRGRLERRARSSSRHAKESKGRSKDKKDKKDKRGKKEIMIMRKPNKAQLFLVRSLH